jgi:hypothetical protein
MEAARTSETSVDNHFTRQYNPEDSSEHHTRRRENLKSHKDFLICSIYLMLLEKWRFRSFWSSRDKGCMQNIDRVLTAASMKVTLFGKTVPWIVVERNRCFRDSYCLSRRHRENLNSGHGLIRHFCPSYSNVSCSPQKLCRFSCAVEWLDTLQAASIVPLL